MAELPKTDDLHNEEEDALIVLADISGYTAFLRENRMALAHASVIVRDLISTIVDVIEAPLEVNEIEGDAVLLFALKEGKSEEEWEECKKHLGKTLTELIKAFHSRVDEHIALNMCSCNVCANIPNLELKIVAHSGKVVCYRVGQFKKLTGFDVIVAHRLLKNNVGSNRYILLTEPARDDVFSQRRCILLNTRNTMMILVR